MKLLLILLILPAVLTASLKDKREIATYDLYDDDFEGYEYTKPPKVTKDPCLNRYLPPVPNRYLPPCKSTTTTTTTPTPPTPTPTTTTTTPTPPTPTPTGYVYITPNTSFHEGYNYTKPLRTTHRPTTVITYSTPPPNYNFSINPLNNETVVKFENNITMIKVTTAKPGPPYLPPCEFTYLPPGGTVEVGPCAKPLTEEPPKETTDKTYLPPKAKYSNYNDVGILPPLNLIL